MRISDWSSDVCSSDLIGVGIGGRQHFLDSEDVGEHPIEPHPRRRAAEQRIMVGEPAPNRAWVTFDRAAVGAWYTQLLQRNALAVEHAEDVMIDRKSTRLNSSH